MESNQPSCWKEPPPIHNYSLLGDSKLSRLVLQPENLLVIFAWQEEWRIDGPPLSSLITLQSWAVDASKPILLLNHIFFINVVSRPQQRKQTLCVCFKEKRNKTWVTVFFWSWFQRKYAKSQSRIYSNCFVIYHFSLGISFLHIYSKIITIYLTYWSQRRD